MVSETIRLTAHEKFIIDGIKRQAGSVEKAVLELVMNAIEAQLHSNTKPVVNIDYSVEGEQAKLVVRDMGRGFKTRNEIEQWFAKFGTPHDECPNCQKTMKLNRRTYVCSCGYQTEGRTWAEFRMGRGQAFSFGRNVWRTGQFRMEYDLETDPDERAYAKPIPPESEWELDVDDCLVEPKVNHVLDFSLQSNLPNQKGCEVTVYFYKTPVGQGGYYRSLEAFKTAIKHHVEFMEGQIIFNGEQVNTPASELTWDVETEDAYFMFGKGNNLAVYNIGAFVRDYSVSNSGVTGVVVSKDKMRVNFARNDIQHDCPVFERIWIIVRDNKIKKIRRARRWLNSNERISTLIDLRDGDCEYDEIKTLGLFELTDNKSMSLEAVRKIRSPWTFAEPGNRIADQMMQTDVAICFSTETLEGLDYTGDPQKFFDWLLTNVGQYGDGCPNGWDKVRLFFRPFEGEKGLSSGYSDENVIVPTSKLSKAERRFLNVMDNYDCWGGRTLCIGVSDTANGWTDGSTYIAYNRRFLQRNNPQYFHGAAALVTLTWHEMAHDDGDTGTHNHGSEFYQRYHQLTRGTACWMIGELPQKMRKQKWQDRDAEKAIQEAKRKEQRDKRLGIKKVKKVKKAADGITHTPTKKTVVAKVVKKARRRRRF